MDRRDIIPGTPYAIYQNAQYFSYGVDSVVLSNFAQMKKGRTLIDLGAGVGILGLRCHYIYQPSHVWALEIQRPLARLLDKSVKANAIRDNFHVVHGDARTVQLPVVDYIITNPPYMEVGRGIGNKNPSRRISLSEEMLSLAQVFDFSDKHLNKGGRLFMVNRANRLVDAMEEGRRVGLEPRRLRIVHSYIGDKARFFMVEFVKGGGKNFTIEEPLTIYREPGIYTEEIEEIYYV